MLVEVLLVVLVEVLVLVDVEVLDDVLVEVLVELVLVLVLELVEVLDEVLVLVLVLLVLVLVEVLVEVLEDVLVEVDVLELVEVQVKSLFPNKKSLIFSSKFLDYDSIASTSRITIKRQVILYWEIHHLTASYCQPVFERRYGVVKRQVQFILAFVIHSYILPSNKGGCRNRCPRTWYIDTSLCDRLG